MFSWKTGENYHQTLLLNQFSDGKAVQGPVVQSIVSLTSSLRVILWTVLADSIYNILIFFAEKMWVAFALQKLLIFLQQKFQHICVSLDVNFNESLTNDVVSFEQLGPDVQILRSKCGTLFSIQLILDSTNSKMEEFTSETQGWND